MPSELAQAPLGYPYPNLPLRAKVKIAEYPENGYSSICWSVLRGSDAEMPPLCGHPQPPALVVPFPLLPTRVPLQLPSLELVLGTLGQGKTA